MFLQRKSRDHKILGRSLSKRDFRNKQFEATIGRQLFIIQLGQNLLHGIYTNGRPKLLKNKCENY